MFPPLVRARAAQPATRRSSVVLALLLFAVPQRLWAEDEGHMSVEPPAAPSSAAASEPTPPETISDTSPASRAPWSIRALWERRAGELGAVRQSSTQVELVRSGVESQARPTADLGHGDAIRSADGAALLLAEHGGSLLVAERSQLRLGPSSSLRIGAVHWSTAEPLLLDVEGFELRVAGLGRLKWNRTAGGEIEVVDGWAMVVARSGEVDRVEPGTMLRFGGGRPAERGTVAPGTGEILRQSLDAPPERVPGKPILADSAAALIRLDVGFARLMVADWLRAGIDVRGRVHGPFFLGGGFSFVARPAEELVAFDHVFGLVAHGGARVRFPLPRAFWLSASFDGLLLLGEACESRNPCQRRVLPQPGGRLSVLAGTWMGPGFGLELELGLGLSRHLAPATYDLSQMEAAPAALLGVSVGLVLGPPR